MVLVSYASQLSHDANETKIVALRPFRKKNSYYEVMIYETEKLTDKTYLIFKKENCNETAPGIKETFIKVSSSTVRKTRK